MAANTIFVSRFPLLPNAGNLLAAGLLDDAKTRYLFDLEQQELLQLHAHVSATDFAASTHVLATDPERFANHMAGGVERELLSKKGRHYDK